MSKELRLTAAVDIRAAAAEGDKQKPRRFSMVAYTGGQMQLAGWYEPVVVDLAGLNAGESNRPILINHSTDVGDILGQADKIDVRGNQLFVEGVILGTSEAARQVIALNDSGFAWQASIGARAESTEYVREGATAEANGQTWEGPITIVRQSSLGEISFVALGADDKTAAKIAASLKGNAMNTTANNSTTVAPTVNAAAEIEAERQRIEAIDTACVDHPEIAAQAVREGWTVSQAAIAALRAARPTGPAIHPSNRDAIARDGNQAAVNEAQYLCHFGMENLAAKTLGPQAAERARRWGATSMIDVMKASLQMQGRDIPPTVDGIIRASYSYTNTPGILSNVANKILEEAYRAFPSVAKIVAKKLNANDFKQHTGVRLAANATLEEIGARGEIKHGSLGELKYNYQIATYARMFGLSRQDVINDDTGAFIGIPPGIARAAAAKLEGIFWALVMAYAGFHTDNGNIISGGDSVLGEGGLNAALVLMANQTDASGDPIMITPKFLVVPPELGITAEKFYGSLQTTGGTNNIPNANVFFQKYQPLVVPHLSNANYTGNSTTQWFLFGDPADVAAFGIAYLNGNESPIIEQQDASFDTLGIQFRGYHDFGVCAIDPKGAVKSAGA